MIIASLPIQIVMTITTRKVVMTSPPIQCVVAVSSEYGIVPIAAAQSVIKRVTRYRIIPRSADGIFDVGSAGDCNVVYIPADVRPSFIANIYSLIGDKA